MYLEGSDQHRGWFHSSLLESCGTRGRAPYDVVLTHGFTLDEHGRKMSKSLGNTVEPQKVIKDSGADILRLWVAASDYADDQRIGPEILKNTIETYRKLRNTIRWMLGTLAHFKPGDDVDHADMPELERLMLHRLSRGRCDRARGLRELRLQDRGRGAVELHEHRPVGVLLRYPQGRALLRAAVVADAQGGADHGRHPLRCDPEVAGADPRASRRTRRGRIIGPHDTASVHLHDVPGQSRRLSATTRWRRSGRPSATCAASSPARWSWSARQSASAHRSRRRRWFM